MAKTIIATTKAPGAIGPYSQGIKANGFVFASGQLGLVPETGQFAEGGVTGQTRQSLTNVKHVLEAAGSGFFAAMNAVYSEFFKEDCPARSAVQVAALPKDGLVEIEVIAEA